MKELRIVEDKNGSCYIRFYEHKEGGDPDGEMVDGLLAEYNSVDEAVEEAENVKDEYGCDYISVRIYREPKEQQ